MSTTKLPRATLRILRRPDLAPDAKRIEVDCRCATTGLTLLPQPELHLIEGVMVIIAATAHEERCGRCDVSEVLAKGDQQLRQTVDNAWPKLQAELAERMMKGRRN